MAESSSRHHRPRATVVAMLIATTVLAAGCARFDERATTPFEPEPTDGGFAHIRPAEPTDEPPDDEASDELGPCDDPDPAVIATCLEPVTGIAVLPSGEAALAAERATGRIMEVAPELDPVEFLRIDVDASSGGGLLDIALSPAFGEDRLLYALITTPTDNRVVRIAPGDVAKPLLTGLPRGTSGNAGGLAFAPDGSLLVRTGDGGNPASATNPGSLGGKVLRLDSLNPSAPRPPEIIAPGARGTGSICPDPGNGTIYITERTPGGDQLLEVLSDGTLRPLWQWQGSEGAAECAVVGTDIAVVLTDTEAVAFLSRDEETGLISGDPVRAAEGRFGKLHGAAVGLAGEIWSGTINKDIGEPVETDDRVVLIPSGSGGGVGPD
ncbi:PQQ-dependent sugar dehydrogenase [Lolliginicoccus levis]|uniref:PQQ-dependent sugar dehydrogenase n=1 Tax=Lolliginicoccus levis TaxID=2919542 RepID=UPI00241FBFA8|nr:PQQ-dependent sugar dehydrogenase [Lolliginicoccus levis]